ncbi:MAG: hypothetical protein HY812_10335 [Planctomycetes bacterium]|nr:hypothetical protein [Planctomycetota bacterium]
MNRPVWYAALATAAALGLQVLLPRVFSVVLWYHLGFFAVSLAMLGLAAGGLVVRRRVERSGRAGGGLDLDLLAALSSISIPTALALVLRLPIDPTALAEHPGAQCLLGLAGLVLAAPFALLGTLACACLDLEQERIGRAYGATFFGGAAGALVCLGVMEEWGAPAAAGALALLPLLGLSGRLCSGSSLAALVVTAAALLAPARLLPFESRKHFPHIAAEQVIAEEWNAFSRVTFYRNPEHHGLWAIPASYGGPLPDSIGVAIDSWAITSILERGADPAALGFLGAYPPALAFVGAEQGFDALVIGAGGGVDVLAALEAGAGRVDAVEINPLIVDAVRGRFREFSGALYDDPRVHAAAAEGRHFVETRAGLYDRIVLSGVDTFAATEAGAFALAENYLYTEEAIAAYLEHLRPGGILAIGRWWFEPPRQTLRLALTAAAVLEARGGPDARLCLFVARAERNSFLLLKNGTLTGDEVQRLTQACQPRGAEIVFAPGAPAHATFAAFLDPARRAALLAEYPYRVDPTTDDRPFFFENARPRHLFQASGDWIHDRLGGLEVLVVTMAVLLVLSLPLFWFGGLRGAGRLGGRFLAAAPFAFLGLAYMLVEVPLLQRLSLVLGHPVLAVAVVLVALLLGSGAGSLMAGRLEPARAHAAAFAAAGAVLVVPCFSHQALLDAVAGAGGAGRVLAVIAFLSLPAFAMGIPFPLGVRALRARGPLLVPIAFLANGVASVLACPAAVLLSIAWGFSTTLLGGVVAYAAAGALLLAGARHPAAAGGRGGIAH